MFDQIKKLFGGIVDHAADPGPDRTVFPVEVNGRDLANVPPEVVAGYIGQKVVSVEPLTRFGARTSSGLGLKLQERILNAQARASAVVAGDQAPRAPQEQALHEDRKASTFAQLQAEAAAGANQIQPNSWTINCDGGKRATLQLFPLGDAAVNFENMKATESAHRTQQGARQRHNSWTEQHVRRLMAAPHESYCQPGLLVARGQSHDALVQGYFGTAHDYESLAALAALGFGSAEGASQPSA